MERMFLIYFSYVQTLGKSGISGGRRGAMDVFMLILLLSFGIALVEPGEHFFSTGGLGYWTYFYSLESLAGT